MILLLLASAFISVIMRQLDDALSITFVSQTELKLIIVEKIIITIQFFKKAILIVVTVAFFQVGFLLTRN
jgi:hypothetical protein